MKPEDAQQSQEACQIAVDDLLQVGHLTAPPGIELLRPEEIHTEQYVDGTHNLAPTKNVVHRSHDSWIERVLTAGIDTDPSLHLAATLLHVRDHTGQRALLSDN